MPSPRSGRSPSKPSWLSPMPVRRLRRLALLALDPLAWLIVLAGLVWWSIENDLAFHVVSLVWEWLP